MASFDFGSPFVLRAKYRARVPVVIFFLKHDNLSCTRYVFSTVFLVRYNSACCTPVDSPRRYALLCPRTTFGTGINLCTYSNMELCFARNPSGIAY